VISVQGMLYIHFVYIINRKASLALLRKMMHYITPVLLDEMCSLEGANVNFGSQLVEVLSVVLDNEVRFEVTYTVFCYSFDALLLLTGWMTGRVSVRHKNMCVCYGSAAVICRPRC